MIKVYGSNMCHDCRELKQNFDAYEIRYQFIDINDNLRNLSRFLRLRDTREVFAQCREIGDIGVPAMVLDNGEVTLKWREWLQKQGYQLIGECGIACDIPGE
ncbi:MAG: glutaredoxin [Erysipelotrichaceae bacterium]|nr:glutaredoxin [Erysipelotrichaceae bacterium]